MKRFASTPSQPAIGVLAAYALLALALLLPAAASADSRFGDGTLNNPGGLAVSAREGGNIYVANSAKNRIDEFEPSGAFVRAFGWGVQNGAAELQVCTASCQTGLSGANPGEFSFADAIAIDNDPLSTSYGDVYVVDQRNYRVEKFGPGGEFLLMFGGEVDKTSHADVCTEADLEGGDVCGVGVPGTGSSHFFESGSLDWEHEGSNSIALGPNGETVYVGDYGRVQEFTSNGAFAGELKLEDPEEQFVTALAVDSSGDIFERSAVYQSFGGAPLTQVPGVREYEPAPGRSLLRTFDTEEAGADATQIALDEKGDLFLSNYGGGAFQFRAFKPTGALYAIFSSDQVLPQKEGGVVLDRFFEPAGIAVGDAVGDLYATSTFPAPHHIAVVPLPTPGPPAVKPESETATDIEPATVTLKAVVNPHGFDTEVEFEYLTQAEYEAHGDSFAGAPTTSRVHLSPLIHDDPVSIAVSGLSPETAYRFRAVAVNHCNEAEPLEVCEAHGEGAGFETLPPVSVRGFTTQTVGPEEVVFKAELSPDNSVSPTVYTIAYEPCEPGNACSSTGELNVHGNEFEDVKATFIGLKPKTTYHYGLFAENEFGQVETADATFTTEPSAAEEREAELAECENVILREENNSIALPDCRAYERVSYPEKGGYPAFPANKLSPSGERVAYDSSGSFAGATAHFATVHYLAHRTGSGWVTQAAVAASLGTGQQPTPTTFEPNAELDSWLFSVQPGPNVEAATGAQEGALYRGEADGSYLKATPTLAPVEAASIPLADWFEPFAFSSDFSRLFIYTGARLLESDPRPSEPPAVQYQQSRIYEVAGAGGPAPSLRLAAELPLDLIADKNCTLNRNPSIGRPTRLASADGSLLFYTAPLDLEPGGKCGLGNPNPYAVFACHAAAGSCVEGQPGYHEAIRLSAPPPPQCHSPSPCAGAAPANAFYYGDSADGARVWFTTTQPLVDSDADAEEAEAAGDLYLARLAPDGSVEELVQASHGEPSDPTAGANAGVQTVVAVSPDGQHAYFVATGLLTTQPNGAGETASLGADNLYAYDAASGRTSFVARLCSGPASSGTAVDAACAASLESGKLSGAHNDHNLLDQGNTFAPQAHLTPDGRYLVFDTYARLVPGDTDAAPDVYRYDLQTGGLLRLSFGRDGNDAGGNDDAYPAEIGGAEQAVLPSGVAEDDSRVVSADGSRVVFETAAPLVSRDVNAGPRPACEAEHTGCDVYEWEEEGSGSCREPGGCVSLISDGRDAHGAEAAVISASGRDVTFYTSRGLVPGDTDGIGDVYDAREGGGFAPSPPPQICEGPETCHGPAPEPQLQPSFTSSETRHGPEGEREPLKCAKGKRKVKKHGQVRCVPNRHHKHKGKRRHKRAAARQGGRR
jgi:DNA-binding beta-propeller fold protein YncE